MNWLCILICAAIWSGVVGAKSESTTLSSPIASTSANPKASAKVKRQFPFERPPNYSPYVGDAALDAARRNVDANAQTINQVDQKDSNGNFNYAYETTNGIKARQTSYMVGPNRVVVGYYSYVGPDGKIYTTHYTADQNGYRASGSHLPAQDTAVQPLPFVSSTPGPIPFASSTPAPFFSSTPAPFLSSTPFPPSPFNSVPSPSAAPFRAPYRPINQDYSPTTASPIVSSSTPFPSSVVPFSSTGSPFSPTRRPHFPLYEQSRVPFRGYTYTNPRINAPYSVVSQQTPGPIFFPSSTEHSRVTTTIAPPPFSGDFNAVSSTTARPFDEDARVRFREYVPPVPIQSAAPRPLNSFIPNQPDTIVITPKPFYNQPRLPNSLAINQNILPPYLSVGPLNSPFGPTNAPIGPPNSIGPQNFYRPNGNFVNDAPFNYNEPVRPLPQQVAPLTVTDLNFRKKRDFDKN